MVAESCSEGACLGVRTEVRSREGVGRIDGPREEGGKKEEGSKGKGAVFNSLTINVRVGSAVSSTVFVVGAALVWNAFEG
jgi:hypothetical protein